MKQLLKTPLFSIVMPVYNAANYVGRAIESVLAQTDTDWELILVDDCSTDSSVQIMENFAREDKRIKIHYNHYNRNVAPTLNRGIRAAVGEWIVRLDADDAFQPEYLEILRMNIQSSGSERVFFSTWVTIIDEADEKILDVRLPEARVIERMMKHENFLYHSATSFTKDLWQRVGGYSEEERTIAEDTMLWMKFFANHAKLIMIPEHLIQYRIHYSNVTSLNDAKLFQAWDEKEERSVRQNREWRISLYLKQKMIAHARQELWSLGSAQRRFSIKNLQYLCLTFLPASLVAFFMWEFRPRMRSLLKFLSGPSIRV